MTVPGETVNRLCASRHERGGERGARGEAGDGDFYIAGGVEQMTRAPYVMSKASQPFARNVELFDTSLGWRFVNPKMRERYGVDSMGQTAENVAEQYGISREDQDPFALRSQQKAAAAAALAASQREIVPVTDARRRKGEPAGVFAQDEFIRPDTTLERLAKLKPAFRTDGKGIGDRRQLVGHQRRRRGAADRVGAGGAASSASRPMARIVATAVAGVEPRIMGMGPVPATRKALAKRGLRSTTWT